jgi:enterobactin synthetase component D
MKDTTSPSFITGESLTHNSDKRFLLSECSFDVAAYRKEYFRDMAIVYPDGLERAVAKRQSEFLAGRYAAQSGFKLLGLGNPEVAIGVHRSPVWPNEVIGSISHTGQVAMCALSLKNENDFLGIDVESLIASKVADDIRSTILSADEESFLRRIDHDFAGLVTLIFSAKESLFKALYPHVGSYFGFEVAKLVELNFEAGSLIFELRSNLSSKIILGSRFSAHFQFNEHTVMTSVSGKFQV